MTMSFLFFIILLLFYINSSFLTLNVIETIFITTPVCFINYMYLFSVSFFLLKLLSIIFKYIRIFCIFLVISPAYFYRKYYNFFKFVVLTFPETIFNLSKYYYRDFMLKNRYPFVDKSLGENFIAKKSLYFYFWCFKSLLYEDLYNLFNKRLIVKQLLNLYVIIYDGFLLIKLLTYFFIDFIKISLIPFIIRNILRSCSLFISFIILPYKLIIFVHFLFKNKTKIINLKQRMPELKFFDYIVYLLKL